jgi:hypothetical protein
MTGALSNTATVPAEGSTRPVLKLRLLQLF